MNEIDVNQEWSRLQELYAGMDEDELQLIADDAYDLTELARQAFKAEVSRRGLKMTLRGAPASAIPEPPSDSSIDLDPKQLTDLHRVWSREEAVKMKEILDWAGVPVFFGPDLIEDPLQILSFEQGVDTRVRDFDQQRAYAALAKGWSREHADDPPSEEKEEDYVARCPKCHSDQIVFESLDPGTSPNQSAFDSVYNWSCDACGYKWQDDGIESDK
jgi:hypothetical protein